MMVFYVFACFLLSALGLRMEQLELSREEFVDEILTTHNMQFIRDFLDHRDFDEQVKFVSYAVREIVFGVPRGRGERCSRKFLKTKILLEVLARDSKLFRAVEGRDVRLNQDGRYESLFSNVEIRNLRINLDCVYESLFSNSEIQLCLEHILFLDFNSLKYNGLEFNLWKNYPDTPSKFKVQYQATPESIDEARTCFSFPADIRPRCHVLHMFFGKYIGGDDIQNMRPLIPWVAMLYNVSKKCQFRTREGIDFSKRAMAIIFDYLLPCSIGARSDIFCSECIAGVLPRVCKAFVKCPINGVRINRKDASGCIFNQLDDDSFREFFKRLVNIPYGGVLLERPCKREELPEDLQKKKLRRK